ncbi:MAG: TrbC/VirB2 family protein [bacterium]|nr:TrbC/VirB2 family protein [bacterium]
MGILKFSLKTSKLTKVGLLSLALGVLMISPAAAQDLSPITTMLQSIGTALTTTVGRALGLVALAAIGILFLTGRMNWLYAGSVIVGLVILFGAATILAGF